MVANYITRIHSSNLFNFVKFKQPGTMLYKVLLWNVIRQQQSWTKQEFDIFRNRNLYTQFTSPRLRLHVHTTLERDKIFLFLQLICCLTFPLCLVWVSMCVQSYREDDTKTALSRWRSLWLLGYSISVTRTLICSQGGVVYYYSYYN